MPFSIYKPGQGYWTRVLSAVGVGVLTLAAGAWAWEELAVIQSPYAISIRAGVAAGIIVVLAALIWWVMNKPKVVDFMIATESEMRKVNWPSRREIIGSTWVVICGTLMIALLLFAVDLAFAKLFQSIQVLEGVG